MLLHALPAFDHIDLELREAGLQATLRTLFEPLAQHGAVKDADRAWKDLLLRQQAGAVALDADIGLPHARTGGVNRVVLAAGRHVSGVPFDGEHKSVRLLFLILTPKEQPVEYLQLVAELASRLRQPALKTELLTATSPEAFAAALRS